MKKEVTNKYAQAYLTSLDDVVEKDGMHGLLVQIKYIKENLKSWRGETAKEVKAFLTKWIEEKEKETK
jgi:hypothetical protein